MFDLRTTILEDDHQPIAGCLVHILLLFAIDLKETGKIILYQPVKLSGVHLLRQTCVSGDIEKQDRDVFFTFFQLGGVRVLLQ